MMIYKSAPRQDIGSYTSTNSSFRNAYVALLGLVAGWIIYISGSNFVIGFSIGMAMSTVGLLMFFIYHRLMSCGTGMTESRPERVGFRNREVKYLRL